MRDEQDNNARANMQIKVLVVDDSRFYRNRLCNFLGEDPQIHVVGTAENGKDAVEKVKSLKPDVITMDIEMPIMDGITAVREIMKSTPLPILMFSSLTSEGAKSTLDALDAGAVDFMLKRLEDMAYSHAEFSKEICAKVRAVAKTRVTVKRHVKEHHISHPAHDAAAYQDKKINKPDPGSANLSDYRLIIIGASTGGPSAIQGILTSLPKGFSVPIVIVQHMPSSFTGPFARRLDSMASVAVKEASDGDEIQAGHVYVAPGGKQLLLEKHAAKSVIRINDGPQTEQYKPSVDVTFKSAAETYGKDVLGIVLTGMGSDGCKGAAQLKGSGAVIWAQNEESSVVYGMPQAVAEAGLVDSILSITDIAHRLTSGV